MSAGQQRKGTMSEETVIWKELAEKMKAQRDAAREAFEELFVKSKGDIAQAFAEGRDAALANAAMTAYGMGHPDVRKAINRLMPDDSPAIPMDDERNSTQPPQKSPPGER